MKRGEELALQGDKSKNLPACTSCHGVNLAGAVPAIPGLLGLPRDYIAGQLGAWQTAQRKAHAPDCMAQVAKQLSPEDVSQVATWLAAQPIRMPYQAAQLKQPLPQPCGGMDSLSPGERAGVRASAR